MKIQFTCILIGLIFLNCTLKSVKEPQGVTINNYFSALNATDFNAVQQCIDENIRITEGDYVITENINQYYTFFQWDSVFKPTYELLKIDTPGANQYEINVSKTCDRIRFLHDSPTVYILHVELKDNRIAEINTKTYLDFNIEKWQNRRDSLVQWVDRMHPKLNGFVHDQTPAGALNYLKAITYYSSAKKNANQP